MQVRVARPARNFEAVVSFYRDVVGLPVLASFEDHDGYSGVVFGLKDASRQLELVFHEDQQPAPTSEDQLVLYLGSAERVTSVAARIGAAGFEPTAGANPYWARTGAVCFLDPDGYALVISPESW
jgi:predicted enzyme related to lactoylglutathione lyase